MGLCLIGMCQRSFSPLSLRFCTYNVLYKKEVEDPPVYVIFTYLKGINVKVNPHTLEW